MYMFLINFFRINLRLSDYPFFNPRYPLNAYFLMVLFLFLINSTQGSQ